jgi:hypothetical protein
MTASLKQIQLLMNEVGPSTPYIDVVMQNNEDTWAIGLANESIITLEWVDDPSRLILSAKIGCPDAEKQVEAYRMLLIYNRLWRENGGVTTALSGEENNVTLLYELNAENLNLGSLRTVLLNFAVLVGDWHTYLAGDLTYNLPVPTANAMRLLA